MAERRVLYNIEAVDNTKNALDSVDRNVENTTKTVEKESKVLTKTFKAIGEEQKKLAETFKKETTSAITNLRKAFVQAFTAPIKLISSVVSGIVGLGLKAAKTMIIMKLLTLAWTKFGDAADHATRRGRTGVASLFTKMQKFVAGMTPVKNAFNAIITGNRRMLQQIPLLDRMVINFKNIGMALTGAFQAGTQGVSQFTLSLNGLSPLATKLVAFLAKASFQFGMMFKRMGQVSDGVGNVFRVFTKFKLLLPTLAAVAAGVIAITLAWKQLNQTIKEGDMIDKASRRIGFSATAFVAWDHVMKRAGTSIQEMETTVAGFSKRLFDAARGTGEAKEALKILGMEATTLEGGIKNNEKAFTEVITKLSQMEDTAARNAITLAVFGETGRRLIPVLDEFGSGLGSIIGNYTKHEKLINRNAAASAVFADHMTDLGASFKLLRMELFTPTIERLNDFLDIMRNNLLLKMFGKTIVLILKGIMGLANAVIDVVNIIVSAFDTGFRTILLGWQKIINAMITGLYKLLNTINRTKLGDKFVSDVALDKIRQLTIVSNDAIIETEKALEASAARTARSIASLFKIRPDDAKPATAGETTVIPGAKAAPAKAAGPGAGRGQDLSALEAFNNARMAMLEKFAQWSIANMSDRFAKERALVEVEFEKRKAAVYEAETFGHLTAAEAAKARVELEKWKSAQIIDINKQQASKQRSIITNSIGVVISQFSKIHDASRSTADAVLVAFTGVGDSVNSNFEKIFTSVELLNESAGAGGILSNALFGGEGAEGFRGILESTGEMVNSLFSGLSMVAQTGLSQRLEALDKENASIKESFSLRKEELKGMFLSKRTMDKSLEKLDKEQAKKEAEINAKKEAEQKKAAKSQLQLQLFQSIASTALGIANGLTMMPPPVGIAMAAIIGTMGAVSQGIIMSQLSKFATGGIVEGESVGDRNLVRVNGGEMIFNKSQQKNLLDLASGRQRASTQPLSVDMSLVIEGNVDSATMDRLDESRDRQLVNLKEMLEDLKDRNELNYVLAD